MTALVAFFALFAMMLFNKPVLAEEQIHSYLDGQEQPYQGQVVQDVEGIWIPLKPILLKLNDVQPEWEIDTKMINDFLRERRLAAREEREIEADLLEVVTELKGIEIKDIDHREMIHLDDVEWLGFDVYFFQNERILHINTPKLGELAELYIGDHKEKVDQLYEVHWNTGFGQGADLIGFIGDMLPYSYIDRYGYERTGEVPELQVEIKDGQITYLFVSSDRFETSKKIKIGDRLSDVYRVYGSQYVRDRVDGKQIVVYDVEFGSIWFIANEKQIIERIAFWDHHLRGFGDSAVQKLEETS